MSFGNNKGSYGTATLEAAKFSGLGRLRINANYTNGVDVRVLGAVNHAGLTQVSSGDFRIDGDYTASTYLQDGGHISGQGLLAVNGSAIISGGSQGGTGTTVFYGPLSITGTHTLYGPMQGAGRTVLSNDTTTWTAGNIVIEGAGTWNNNGTWLDNTTVNSQIGSNISGFKLFNNAGSFVKSGDTTTTINTSFNNTGTIVIETGELHVLGGSQAPITGHFHIADGSTLSFLIRNVPQHAT